MLAAGSIVLTVAACVNYARDLRAGRVPPWEAEASVVVGVGTLLAMVLDLAGA